MISLVRNAFCILHHINKSNEEGKDQESIQANFGVILSIFKFKTMFKQHVNLMIWTWIFVHIKWLKTAVLIGIYARIVNCETKLHPQQAHNIKTTLYQRRCDVMSHRLWYAVDSTSCAFRDIVCTENVINFFSGSILHYPVVLLYQDQLTCPKSHGLGEMFL